MTRRKLTQVATNAAIFACALVFALGVHDTLSAKPGAQPPSDLVPFNSLLFFILFAAPILISLFISVGFFAIQQYRASNGSRNRGWEEEW